MKPSVNGKWILALDELWSELRVKTTTIIKAGKGHPLGRGAQRKPALRFFNFRFVHKRKKKPKISALSSKLKLSWKGKLSWLWAELPSKLIKDN